MTDDDEPADLTIPLDAPLDEGRFSRAEFALIRAISDLAECGLIEPGRYRPVDERRFQYHVRRRAERPATPRDDPREDDR